MEGTTVTVEDAHKLEYQGIRSSAMRTKPTGRKSTGAFASDEIPEGENVITAKWGFRWKSDANG